MLEIFENQIGERKIMGIIKNAFT